MAVTPERTTPWPAEPDGAMSPAVVCVLNGSPPGRAAAAYAAALSRALHWRLGLVASGLQPLDMHALVAAMHDESAGLAVVPAESFGAPTEAIELAIWAGTPVIVVPPRWDAAMTDKVDVVVYARHEMPELAGAATRIAVARGVPLRLVHAHDRVSAGSERERAHAVGLTVVAIDDEQAIDRSFGAEPLMLVPTAQARRLAA